MKRFIAMGVVAMWVAVLGMNSAAAAAAGSTLDGKTFVGNVGKQGETKGDQDTFIFKEGTFRSTACDPYGFKPGSYRVVQTTPEGKVKFEATCASSTDGTMSWKGTASGSQVEGTSTWQKPGQPPIQHWFKGQVKQ